MHSSLWTQVRRKAPLIHAISNIVTANDCANLLLAVGARPIMAQAPEETAEITAACSVTVLNLGTPNEEKYHACLRAGLAANELEHPVVIDPVGVGASPYRMKRTRELLERVKPQLIRANYSEVQALLGLADSGQGVDSPLTGIEHIQSMAEQLARQRSCVVFVTGPEDIVTDGTRTRSSRGGSIQLRSVTGTGCMLTVLCGALMAVTDPFTAAATAGETWRFCAAQALKDGKNMRCPGQYHMALLDAAGGLGRGEEHAL